MSHQAALALGRHLFKLTGTLLMVEKLPDTEVKTASGLVMATNTSQMNGIGASMPVFLKVVAVGEGTYDDDGIEEAVDVQPGAIILVGDSSVRWLSHMPMPLYQPNSIGITRENEIQIKFETEEDYNQWRQLVSKGSETKVE